MTSLVEQRARRSSVWFIRAGATSKRRLYTLNATGALKLVGEERTRSAQGAGLLLSNRQSQFVNGIREFARAKGAPVRVRNR
jgi:hypothetical protein